MVYQGKPSAGCVNCRKRKIKVRTSNRPRQCKQMAQTPADSVTREPRLARSVSTPSGPVPAMSPASTSFSETRRKRFAERLSDGSSPARRSRLSGDHPKMTLRCRQKSQSQPSQLMLRPAQETGPSSTAAARTTRMLLAGSATPSHACSTTLPSSKPSVLSS